MSEMTPSQRINSTANAVCEAAADFIYGKATPAFAALNGGIDALEKKLHDSVLRWKEAWDASQEEQP